MHQFRCGSSSAATGANFVRCIGRPSSKARGAWPPVGKWACDDQGRFTTHSECPDIENDAQRSSSSNTAMKRRRYRPFASVARRPLVAAHASSELSLRSWNQRLQTASMHPACPQSTRPLPPGRLLRLFRQRKFESFKPCSGGAQSTGHVGENPSETLPTRDAYIEPGAGLAGAFCAIGVRKHGLTVRVPQY